MRKTSAVLLIFAASAALAAGISRDSAMGSNRAFSPMEALALSSVAGSVPNREAARKAQAAAIMEARGMGLHIAVASVGTGGNDPGDFIVDEQAFVRLIQRFSKTASAAGEGAALRERLIKTWMSKSKLPSDGSAFNASSQVIYARGRDGACVVEIRASGEGLRAMLSVAYDAAAIEAIEREARSLDVSAMDVAFLVSAHESAHCVISMALNAGLLDAAWVDPKWKAPPSWGEALTEDDDDSAALSKAQEGAADILAIFWAEDALGVHKARQLARLTIHARFLGGRSVTDDGLHDSSRVLAGILAPAKNDHTFPVADAAHVAWKAATRETRSEIIEYAALVAASGEQKDPEVCVPGQPCGK